MDPVQGVEEMRDCGGVRDEGEKCGPDGKLWEEKVSIFHAMYEFLRDMGRVPG